MFIHHDEWRKEPQRVKEDAKRGEKKDSHIRSEENKNENQGLEKKSIAK